MANTPATDRRVVIEAVSPKVDCGRFAAKSVVGDPIVVKAKVFADGHDAVVAVLEHRRSGNDTWNETPMDFLGNDSWEATFTADELGTWEYRITGWVDHFVSWAEGLKKKFEAGVVSDVDLAIGAELLAAASDRSKGKPAKTLQGHSKTLSDTSIHEEVRVGLALSEEVTQLMGAHPDRSRATTLENPLPVIVDRQEAVFSSWYELFPRSWSTEPGRHGTFADVEAHLDYVDDLGFDVLYLPPIHPIGEKFRKGPNNTLDAGPKDPGVPWAIGSKDGGHMAIHPELGTAEDFRSLVDAAAEKGISIALDIALQVSPDHPWVDEHPEWFKHRPDGTIQYAENPPKKYQDIYPIDFETSNPEALWKGLKEVFDHWIDQGVKIFRVDNPHTKSFSFWEWLITETRTAHPDVIYLAEAFTRPAVMHRLAKLGFNQSYTYFAWRNSKSELIEYMSDLDEVSDFFRPNFWPNTPDILTEMLQTGTRAAFVSRVVLAATLSASYGIYGPAFELMEHQPLRPGSEEYLNSEKYQIRQWDLRSGRSLAPLITQLNKARRAHPALQRNGNLVFHDTDNEMILAYSKSSGTDTVLVIVTLDPHHTQSAWVDLDLAALRLEPEQQYQLHDLLTDRRYVWTGSHNFVQLDVEGTPAHVFHVRRQTRTEQDFDYYI